MKLAILTAQETLDTALLYLNQLGGSIDAETVNLSEDECICLYVDDASQKICSMPVYEALKHHMYIVNAEGLADRYPCVGDVVHVYAFHTDLLIMGIEWKNNEIVYDATDKKRKRYGFLKCNISYTAYKAGTDEARNFLRTRKQEL